MFSSCKSLERLNLFSFNTSKVTNMSFMFYECKSLKELKLSKSFTTSKETNIESIFDSIPKTCKIICFDSRLTNALPKCLIF